MSTRGNLKPTAPEGPHPLFAELEGGKVFTVGRFHDDESLEIDVVMRRYAYAAVVAGVAQLVYLTTADYLLGTGHLNTGPQFGVALDAGTGLSPDRRQRDAGVDERDAGRLGAVDLQPVTFRRPPPDPVVVSTGTLIWPEMAYDDVVAALRRSRFKPVAERLDYLYESMADDQDIYEVSPDSVVAFGTFLLVAQPTALPLVGIDPSGYVFAQWNVEARNEPAPWGGEEGSIVAVFEPTKLVHLTARCGGSTDGTSPVELNGVVPVQALANTLHFFLSKATAHRVDDDDTSTVARSPVAATGATPFDVPDSVEEGIGHLRASGFVEFAERLEHLHREIEDDPDESPTSLESLKVFVNFVVGRHLPGSPSVWVDPYGYVGLEWRIPDPERLDDVPTSFGYDDDRLWGKGDGILAIVFLPNGSVKLAGTSGPVGRGVERLILSETVPTDSVIDSIQPFLRRMEAA